MISLASAFARSTWARTTRIAAARGAFSWAIRPGGGSEAGRALSGLGRSGSSGRPPRGWAVVRETAADHSSARWRHRRVRSRHGRCNRVPIAGADAGRAIVTAELLAIGTELTVGETTDTNSGELARSLVGLGVRIVRISNLPDDLAAVVDALRTALGRADLVVTTGGLGPTPDDLTREAVAEACGEQPVVDEATLEWLRGLWARRRQPFPETNLKQAWVLPSGRCSRTPTAPRPAGGSTGPTAG